MAEAGVGSTEVRPNPRRLEAPTWSHSRRVGVDRDGGQRCSGFIGMALVGQVGSDGSPNTIPWFGLAVNGLVAWLGRTGRPRHRKSAKVAGSENARGGASFRPSRGRTVAVRGPRSLHPLLLGGSEPAARSAWKRPRKTRPWHWTDLYIRGRMKIAVAKGTWAICLRRARPARHVCRAFCEWSALLVKSRGAGPERP